MSAISLPHPRLPDQITINFGPPDVLGRAFLALDYTMRSQGIYLSISDDFKHLAEVNRRNGNRLLPMFDPAFGGVKPENSFWIRGVNEKGEVVVTHAARLYVWSKTSLSEELSSLRFFYPDPATQKKPAEACIVESQAASEISGRVCYSGAVWVHPDYRGRGLAHVTPRLVRAYSLTKWYPDFSLGMVQLQKCAGGKAAQTYGWRNVDAGIHWLGSCEAIPEIEVAFGWLKREDVIADIEQFTRLLREPAHPIAA